MVLHLDVAGAHFSWALDFWEGPNWIGLVNSGVHINLDMADMGQVQ
jgi:hypothetical protein